MRIPVYCYVWILVLAVAPVASAYTIGGKVYGGSTAIAYAKLSLYDATTSQQIGSSVTSDSVGNYQIPGVIDGEYKVYVTVPTGTLYRSSWVGPPTFVVAGEDVSRDIILTDPAVTVSGTVKTPSGVGIGNIRVCTSSTPTYKCAVSDNSGAYTITGLDVGSYSLNVYPYGPTNIPSPIGGFSINNIISSLSISADVVQDIVIPLVTLNGKTTDMSETVAVPGVRINFPSRSWVVGVTSFSVGDQTLTSDSGGNYSAVLLPYNNYGVNLTPLSGTSYVATSISGIDVPSSSTTNLKLKPAYSITGQVKTDKGVGISNVKICAFPLNSFTDSKCSVSDSAGNYVVAGLDLGTYRLTTYKYGTTNIPTPEGFSISPIINSIQVTGNMVQHIVIPVVTLSGRVADRNGVPVAKATVSMPSQSWTVNSVYNYVGPQSSITDANGVYSFPLLPYSAYAINIVPPAGSLFSTGGIPSLAITSDTEQAFSLQKTIPEYKIDIAFSGGGAGTVTSYPAGISCLNTPCSWYFDQNTAVSLFPTSDAISVFSGWGGACAGTGGCNMIMDGDKQIIATFAVSAKAMVDGVGYGSVSDAYASANNGCQIRILQTSLQEDLVLDRNIDVQLSGGYASDFMSQTGIPTEFKGVLIIGQGSMTADGIVIK